VEQPGNPASASVGAVSVVRGPDDAGGSPGGGCEQALRAAARRAEDALHVARLRVAAHGRRTTLRARAATTRAEDEAHLCALAEVAEVVALLRAVVRVATQTGAGDVAVPVGSVRVRRHAAATAAVRVPLLVSPRCGGVRIVAGEDEMPTVVGLAATLATSAAAANPTAGASVIVVNPRRRALPAALRGLRGLHEVHDGRGLLAAVGRRSDRGRLVVLDHPHDLGHAGRRLVQAATADHPFRSLLIHHAVDAPEVDLEHLRLRGSRTTASRPAGGCELWPARGGWRWSTHPQLRIELPSAPIEPGDPGAGAAVETAWTPAREPDPEGDARAAGSDLREYERLLDRLAVVARDLDEAVAAARAAERRALDHAAAVRRGTLAAIAVEERSIDLLLQKVGGARSPPGGQPGTGHPARTVAPREDPAAATDLAPLRAARAALARAVDPARRTRGD
jgi:hypothetical protein